MPSAGTPIESIFNNDEKYDRKICHQQVKAFHRAIFLALHQDMLIEYIESFVGAWNHSKNINEAIQAGITEWDM